MGVGPGIPIEGNRVTSVGCSSKGGGAIIAVTSDIAGGEVGHRSIGVIRPYYPLGSTRDKSGGKRQAGEHRNCGTMSSNIRAGIGVIVGKVPRVISTTDVQKSVRPTMSALKILAQSTATTDETAPWARASLAKVMMAAA